MSRNPSRNNHDGHYGFPTTGEQVRFEQHVGMFRDRPSLPEALTARLERDNEGMVMFPEHHMGEKILALNQGDTARASRASESFTRSMEVLAGENSNSPFQPQVVVHTQVQTVTAGNNTPATQQGLVPVAGNGTDQGSPDGVDATPSTSSQ